MSDLVQMLPVSKINFQTDAVGLSESVLEQLYESIKRDGLYTAIVVRPDPEDHGRYLIVQGRHRFYVIAKMLNGAAILATVFDRMSEQEAELATVTENACRRHLKAHDRILMQKRWHELYLTKSPDMVGRTASARARWDKARAAKRKSAKLSERGPGDNSQKSQDATRDTKSQNESNADTDNSASNASHAEQHRDTLEARGVTGAEGGARTFRETYKSATGASDSEISRNARIIQALTEDQICQLGMAHCSVSDMLRIINSTPNDTESRARIVELVTKGIALSYAIGSVVRAPQAENAAGRINEVVGDDLLLEDKSVTDEDWFASICGVFAETLSDDGQYKSDAILYRRIYPFVRMYRERFRAILQDYIVQRRGKRVGQFFHSLKSLLYAAHPKDWLHCPKCKGVGLDYETGMECGKCDGFCYKIKTLRFD